LLQKEVILVLHLHIFPKENKHKKEEEKKKKGPGREKHYDKKEEAILFPGFYPCEGTDRTAPSFTVKLQRLGP